MSKDEPIQKGIIPTSSNSENLGHYRQPLEESDPEKVELVKNLLAQNCPYRKIQELVKELGRGGMGMNTITRISVSHATDIDTRRKEAAIRAERGANLMGMAAEQRVIDAMDSKEELAKIPLKDLAITADIFAKRSDVLNGQASKIVEHRETVGIEEANAAIAKAIVDSAKKAEVTDVKAVEEKP